MARTVPAKTILSKLKQPDSWFGIYYNMNLYRGCQHQCIYCDSRSSCYQLGDLADIRIKDNALQILEKELKKKQVRATVGFGSMNDPYMPIEEKEQLVRGALKLLVKYNYPAHLITKSGLITRDLDLLQQIATNYLAVSFTITTINDELSKIIEPAAPHSSSRFEAMETLAQHGIYTGVTFMPQLPFINDSWEETEALLVGAKNAGAQYIMYAPALTLREGSREYFYKKLDSHFPNIRMKYEQTFGQDYNCPSPQASMLYNRAKTLCQELNLPMRMKHFEPNTPNQLSMF